MKHLPTIFVLASLSFVDASWAAPDTIVPSRKLPATSPWELSSLSQPPSFKWVDTKSSVRSLIYKGEPYQGRATRVFAYFASPGTLAGDVSQDDNLPAVVLLHGGGGTAFREWAELWAKRGYAAVAMDLAGHRPIEGTDAHDGRNRIRLDEGGPNQNDDEKFGSVDRPPADQWPYHAVANAILAHSLIRSFHGVDPQRTAVTGISWGGYLTCIVAGVDSRFKAAVPVYGCGFLDTNSVWLTRFDAMSFAQRQRWVSLWDPSRYLPAVSMPIMFVNGTNDFAYPLDSYMKSFDSVPGIKQLRITVNMPHGHAVGWAPEEIGLFVDHHLRGDQPLATLGDVALKNQEASVRVKNARAPLTSAALHFTADTTAINERTWTTIPATIVGQSVTASAPPHSATAWFFTVEDVRGAIVSSRVILSD